MNGEFVKESSIVIEDLMQQLGINPDEIAHRKNFLSFTENDREVLKTVHDKLALHIYPLVANFYQHLDQYSELQNRTNDKFTRDSLRRAQAGYLESLTAGKYDLQYVQDRLQIGMVHQKIGLEPKWYFGAYSKYLETILQILSEDEKEYSARLVNQITALIKIIFFDINLALDAYHYASSVKISDSAKHIKEILDNVSEGIIGLNKGGEILSVNYAFEKLFGYAAKEIVGQNIQMLIPLQFDSQYHEDIPENYKKEKKSIIGLGSRELDIARKDGKMIEIEFSLKKYQKNNQEGYIGIIRDITRRNKTEAKLQQLSSVVEQTADSVLITNPDGVIVYVNSAFETVTGYTAVEVIGKTPSIMKSGVHNQGFYAGLWRSIKSGKVFRDTLINRRKNGEIYYEDKTITPIYDQKGMLTRFVSTGKDITERIQSEKRIHFLAHHDPVTSKLNRYSFVQYLKQAIGRADRIKYRLAVLCVNLDRFRFINKSLDYHQADTILQQIASRFTTVLDEDGTIARLGNDEFAILLEGIKQRQDVLAVIERIINVFVQPFIVDGQELFLTASIGVCFYPAICVEPESLLKKAESAMQKAKQFGGNQYQFYNQAMDNSESERLNLERELHRALEREEFELYYQPQIEVQTGKVIGVEALLRWRHPVHGLRNPDEFIPILEDTGLIVPVGEWLIREACRQNCIWQEIGLPKLHMAINISPVQIMRPGLVTKVIQILGETGHAPEALHLELTESLMMQEGLHVSDVMYTLSENKVKLSIDDFGTGFSSLAYLKHYPFNVVKLDRTFIQEICENSQDAAIATAIINLAHSLDMQVIAEGVETEEQKAFLKTQGCDYFQGYLFSRPLSPEGIIDLLTINI